LDCLCKILQNSVAQQPKNSSFSRNAIQYVGSIIANCCDSGGKQATLSKISMQVMIFDLLEIDSGKIVETALDLLAALTRDNPATVESIRNASRMTLMDSLLVTM
jgi:hypothetical protein